MKKLFLVLAIVALAVPAFATYEGSFERTYNVNGAVALDVSTHSGDVVVRTGSGNSVVVRGRIRAQHSFQFFGASTSAGRSAVQEIEQNPPVSQSGNNIRIDYPPKGRNISISYDITVPANTSVRARTGSGDVTVDGIAGTLDANTGSGDVRVDRLQQRATLRTGSGNVTVTDAAEVHAQTGSGDIAARSVRGNLRASTGSGNVTIEGTPTQIAASTGSGDVRVHGVRGGVDVSTGSGDISVLGEARGMWRVAAGSGDVELNLPGNAAFQADFRTTNGTIHTNHPVTSTVQGTAREQRRHVAGAVRGGGQLVKVETGSGNIRVN